MGRIFVNYKTLQKLLERADLTLILYVISHDTQHMSETAAIQRQP